MKKFFSTFLVVYLFLFISPIFIGAQRGGDPNADITSIMSQGANRSCLKRTAGGNQAHPATGKMIMSATLSLTGSCLSQSGCEIWLHNTENDNIAVNEKILKNCANGSTAGYCDDTTHEEEELAKDVEVRPGWTHITNFTTLSARPGQTNIALNDNSQAVLGAESSTVPPGDVNISVSDRYAGHVAYSYYAIGDANTTAATETDGTGVVVDEQNASQQLGTIEQSPEVPVVDQEAQKDNCVTLYWDPFGRVFDSVSLEPMAGIDVTLLDDLGNPAVIDGPFDNFDTTKIDNGVYNILVSREADYQLKVDPPSSHLFTRGVNLDPNYSLIYSEIYLPGDIFHEAPMPEIIPEDFDYSKYHHDIPLVPKGKPYSVDPTDVFVVESSLSQIDMNGFVNYSGKATFPRAKICLVGETSRQVVGNCVNAERYGNFRINISKDKVPQERLLLIAEKIDLTKSIIKNNNLDLRKIDFDDQDSLGFEPVLNYIEGYAYDDQGQLIPKAKITVKLKDGDLTFFTTQADDSGFFTIYGKNLPFPEYYLEFTDPTGKVYKKSTSTFVKDNESYIKSEDLDLIMATKSDQPIVNPTTGQLNNQPFPKTLSENNTVSNPPKNSTFNPAVMVILATILLLAGATVGLVLYIKRKGPAL